MIEFEKFLVDVSMAKHIFREGCGSATLNALVNDYGLPVDHERGMATLECGRDKLKLIASEILQTAAGTALEVDGLPGLADSIELDVELAIKILQHCEAFAEV